MCRVWLKSPTIITWLEADPDSWMIPMADIKTGVFDSYVPGVKS